MFHSDLIPRPKVKSRAKSQTWNTELGCPDETAEGGEVPVAVSCTDLNFRVGRTTQRENVVFL